ncbi:MAG TPA: DUF1015 domain-containing protein [Candidatus Acidoferrum sp.]|nr:DUF1015 domain-containing protein [Candidatus Acidoferrum sp.]
MAEIQPFQAFRYNTERAELKDVLTQPYDKITPEMQESYYAASPYNLIQIEKGRPFQGDDSANNVYTRAAAKVEEWIAERVLVQDAAPGIYIYSQEYAVPGTNTRRTRTGFIALGRLEDYENKIVFRHERTLSVPKTDRLELLRHMRVQTGQLFMLYDDPSKRIETLLDQMARANTPVEMVDEYSVTHRLWPVFDRDFIAHVQQHMANQKLVIADGHHRYETALNYRNECRQKASAPDRSASYEFAMMTFINAHSKGLTILPTHRVIRNLADFNFEQFRKAVARFFDWYSYPFSSDEERTESLSQFRKDLEDRGQSRPAIGIYAGGAFYLFLLKRDADLEDLLPDISEAQRKLDVVLLHRFVLEKGLGITPEAVAAEKNITYEREMDAAVAAVDRSEAQLACILNPVNIDQMMQIAMSGEVLPQKSTDFYPKLLSGIAIYGVEGKQAVASVRLSGPAPLG